MYCKGLIVLFYLLCISICSYSQNKLTWSPQWPQQGNTINLQFPGKAVMNVYQLLVNGKVTPVRISADAAGRFELKSTDSTTAFLVVGQDMENKNAKPEPYPVVMYDTDKKPLKGAFASLQKFVSGKKESLSLTATDSLSIQYLEAEFKYHPENKRSHLAAYLYALSAFQKWKAKEMIFGELNALSKKKDLTDNEIAMMSYLYELYGEKSKAEIYAKQLLAKEPKGAFSLSRNRIDGYNEENYTKKLQFYKDLQTGSLPPHMLYHNLVNENVLKGNFAGVNQLIADRPKEVRPRTYYMAATSMIQKQQDLAMARKYAEWGYERAKIDYEDPKDDFDRVNGKFNYGKSAETLGYILTKERKYKEAVAYFDEGKLYAPQATAHDLVDLYLLSMANSSRYAEVKAKIEERIRGGQNSVVLKDALLAVYLQEKGSNTAFETYLDNLLSISNDSIVANVKKKMISNPAPDFTLSDLNGNKVSLSSLKGKVVIVDFWATWCGPCVASFPGMQKAIEKYKNDKDVVFLFVNTWERIPDPIVKVTDFVKTNDLPFTVLMDAGDKVVAAYGVKGIPNKFIIDKKGNIRFNSPGFSGGADALVTEVSTMIEMARN